MGNGALEEWRIRYITCTTLNYISAKIGRAGGKAKNAKIGAPGGGAVELGAKLGQGGGGYYPTMAGTHATSSWWPWRNRFVIL